MANENPQGASKETPRTGATRPSSETGGSKEKRGETQAMAPSSRRMARTEPSPSSFFGSGLLSTNPFMLMRRLFDDLDRMFEETGTGGGRPSTGPLERVAASREVLWMPRVDAIEREDRFIVRADLPGLGKDDIRLEVTDDGLILEGERRREVEEEREGVYRSEREYGGFRRLIPLPEGVDAEASEAKFDNGVLEVSFPLRKDRPRGRRIEIQEGSRGQEPTTH